MVTVSCGTGAKTMMVSSSSTTGEYPGTASPT
jgi:hypothetical protein